MVSLSWYKNCNSGWIFIFIYDLYCIQNYFAAGFMRGYYTLLDCIILLTFMLVLNLAKQKKNSGSKWERGRGEQIYFSGMKGKSNPLPTPSLYPLLP